MIAVVTVLSAGAACLASVAGTRAGDADFDGLTAAINAQETNIVNKVTVSEHYRAYTAYRRYLDLGNLLHDDAATAAPDGAAALNRQKREAWGMAMGLQYTFFPPRYLNPDGAYNTQRELGEAWAEAAQQKDLNPETHFGRASTLRTKSIALTGVLIVFAVAFWLFTLAEVTDNWLKYLFAAGGILFTLASVAAVLLLEAAR
ncbi:MAG: hypothetical protein ACE5GO_03415 [Anaerolineales bacterium]